LFSKILHKLVAQIQLGRRTCRPSCAKKGLKDWAIVRLKPKPDPPLHLPTVLRTKSTMPQYLQSRFLSATSVGVKNHCNFRCCHLAKSLPASTAELSSIVKECRRECSKYEKEMYTYRYIPTYVYICINTYQHRYRYVRIDTYLCTYMYVSIHTYIYVPIETYLHMRIDTNTTSRDNNDYSI
jgi:hypothetical protein